MVSPVDNSFVGGLQGGFLQQNQNSVSGTVAYAVALPPPSTGSGSASTVMPVPCNSGSAAISGTTDGRNVALTVVAGGQTFTLAGTLTADGTTMMGTYSSTAGQIINGASCGTAQSGLQWSAVAVPPLNGAVQGSFHSKANGLLNSQEFPVTGVLNQGENVGASSATVTGTLTFQGYSCLGGASHQTVAVNGEISGNSVVLELFADSGLMIGQIGESLGLNPQVSPVLYENDATGGHVLHNVGGGQNTYGYVVSTKSCNLTGTPFFTDQGNICLAMGTGTGCSQPISLSPAVLSFPAQLVGFSSVSRTITITNTDLAGSTLTGLSIAWDPTAGSNFISGFSDFNGWPSFAELDTCASSPGSTFSLHSQESCTITVFFSPQQSCAWLPSTGATPAQCPPFLGGTVPTPPALPAAVRVITPRSADGNKTFTVPITGIGLSAVIPSTPELNFGAEAIGQSSIPQTLSFTNQGPFPVQILPAASPANLCSAAQVTLTRPVQVGSVDGLRVVQAVNLQRAVTPSGIPTVSYFCDFDSVSNKPNFQISSDSCTGSTLYPGDSCNLNVTYVPQPGTNAGNNGLDYFLELNTQPCSGNSAQPNCEIDSGRFPVELTANPTSPLRMSPGAGLDFGTQGNGTSSNPLTITLTNDPKDPNSGTVSFQGNLITGNFTETHDCGANLDPGSSCTISVVFTPTSTGFQRGTMTINYSIPSSPILFTAQQQTVHLRGTGQ